MDPDAFDILNPIDGASVLRNALKMYCVSNKQIATIQPCGIHTAPYPTRLSHDDEPEDQRFISPLFDGTSGANCFESSFFTSPVNRYGLVGEKVIDFQNTTEIELDISLIPEAFETVEEYGPDISNLQINIFKINEKVSQLKIVDPDSPRWETPIFEDIEHNFNV